MAKKQPDAGDDSAGSEQISTRLFKADSLDLRQLASLLDISAAEAYKRYCTAVVRDALKAELRRKTAELDRGR